MKEKFPIPALGAHARITELLDQEYAVAQSLAQMTRHINEYRARLFTAVVTGKLDVRVAARNLPDEAEPADMSDTDTEDLTDVESEEEPTESEA